MEQWNLQQRLQLSGQKSLYRGITRNVKGVYAKINGTHFIWKVYFDYPPTDEKKELLSMAATEIIADFNEILSADEQYIHHPGNIDFTNELYFHWLYARIDDNYFKSLFE